MINFIRFCSSSWIVMTKYVSHEKAILPLAPLAVMLTIELEMVCKSSKKIFIVCFFHVMLNQGVDCLEA